MAPYRFGLLVVLLTLILGVFSYSPTGQAAPATGPGIGLTVTVGLDPHSCSDTPELSVAPGTVVTYCYTVTNNTGAKLTAHDLGDTVLGTILLDYGYGLDVGASLAITTTAVVNTTTTNIGTWRATSPISYTVTSFPACGTYPDITATGTPLNLLDDGVVDVALPGSFPFYDTYLTSISVSNNGVVTTPGGVLPFTNEPFPNATYRRVIAPYWDDLDEETGNVYVGSWVQVVNSEKDAQNFLPPGATEQQGPFTYFVVEWYERSHYPGPSASGATFMLAMIYPGQGFDGYMFTCYVDTDFGDPLYNSGASATTGINQNGVNAHPYSFDTPDAIFNGGGMRFDNTGIPQVFTATDSATVTVIAPEIEINPTFFEAVHNPAPQSTSQTLTIQNVGNAPLDWNLTEAIGSCGKKANIVWLTPSPTGGSLDQMESINVTVGFDSTGLPDGAYNALLCLSSNDVDENLIPISVQLAVTNPGPTPTPPASTPTVTNTPPPNATLTPTVMVTPTPTGPLNFHLYLPITRRR
jgi:hypothetical protein